jgi:hypothetical protein
VVGAWQSAHFDGVRISMVGHVIAKLKAANEAATRRKSYKRKRVQKEGTLIVEEGLRLTTLKEFGARSDGKKAKKKARVEVGESSQRRCGRCGEVGHNSRTCT